MEGNGLEKARLAEEYAARDIAWDVAVRMALDTMREPDRREWFRNQQIQEKQEAKEAADSFRDLSCGGYVDVE